MSSSQSPGHTFTPLVKRPEAEQAAISSAAKEAIAKEQEIRANSQAQSKVAPNLGFAFTPVAKETAAKETVAAEPAKAVEPTKPAEPKTEQPTTNNENLERVIPAQTAAPKAEKAEKIPSKYRRLLLVALLALALIAIFFFLKPNTPETVEDLQSQGTSLPIEFRPLDEEEAKHAEEARLLEQQQAQAEAAEAAQNAQVTQETAATETTNTETVAHNVEPVAETVDPAPVAAPETVNEPVVPVVRKPDVATSVIHQAETKPAVKTATALKPATPKAESKPAQAKPAQTTVKKAEPAKPATAQTAQPTAKKAEPAKVATAATPAVASKTITVQKGVSLFQNFRDNGLEGNLPELNKMTKLNGATSRLQPGQKITVRLDKNNRIVEMNIGAGKYIRQADGSYIYK